MNRIPKVSAIVLVMVLLATAVASAVEPQEPVSQPGRTVTPLYAGQDILAGVVYVWNSPTHMMVQVDTRDGEWLIDEVQIYVGTDPVPTKSGNPVPGKFPYKDESPTPAFLHTVNLDLGRI